MTNKMIIASMSAQKNDILYFMLQMHEYESKTTSGLSLKSRQRSNSFSLGVQPN